MTSPDAAVLREVSSLSVEQVGAVRAIYEDAFPAELRADFDALLVDRLLVRVSPAGEPEGLALVRALGGTGWTFLRYYAVGARGGGVGSAMFADLRRVLAAEGGSLLVWDVEDPDEPGLHAHEVDEHRRRIRFYERNGGVLLPVTDYAPPHGDDLAGHAPRLRLMCAPLGDSALPPTRDVVLAAFTLRYDLAPSHPAVLAALASIG
ncbi:hypothetical protein [Nocardioides sp. GY 10127]|uniref:hypothetical protein n=1 Tax=Nocardioides sp. GY 10127 TaxID=2569762 RepID=UPI0010A75841|nr:hypothetical protein [Nocardioides sp. GY 10127]TIC86473.1 hypothetical protein E8D37_00785 [Nocardioides sp. GY 10127]